MPANAVLDRSGVSCELRIEAESVDNALMQRVRSGEEAALDELLRRYWRPLVAFSLGFVRDLDNAEDVVQEAFVRVWQRRCDWQPNGSVRSYLYRITRNISLNERRAREVRERWRTHRLRYPYRSSATPAQQFDAQQLRAAIEAAVLALPERRRTVFLLARFHDLSRGQIAEVMGISPQTVANQLCAALSTLREALAPLLDE